LIGVGFRLGLGQDIQLGFRFKLGEEVGVEG